MSRWAYQTDAYADRISTRTAGVAGDAVFLEDTVFHPSGGGQPGDTGSLQFSGTEVRVLGTEEAPEGIAHHIPAGSPIPPVGTPILATVDWPRRYRFMRYHTALHLLSGVVFQRFGSGISGNQIAEDRARMDFSLPEFGRPLAEDLLRSTNAVVEKGLPIEVRFITKAERAARPELVRVATEREPEGDEVRLIDIVGFDVQADGGTHLRSTTEVGVLQLEKIENKGARNKRLYLTLDSRPDAAPHVAGIYDRPLREFGFWTRPSRSSAASRVCWARYCPLRLA